ncbi:hypothetical protein FZZ91_12260 [Synechococcus sp. HB1133]|uniref:hypothetical protein n=1 Tax=unclassified Synechococcus TaxID=2626047 RepID=UPI001408592C|nr:MULTISPECIES: hypothetical protein [unclassified Synechococcus]MCB4423600.1 hypothetical protein [Synechococcus sp. HB1133]MCB4431777.1 hypothetical protein [Synechococcus sp. HBA1120]
MHQQESAGSPELLLRPIRGVAISVWTPRMERPLSPVVNLRLQFMLAVSILNISKGLPAVHHQAPQRQGRELSPHHQSTSGWSEKARFS